MYVKVPLMFVISVTREMFKMRNLFHCSYRMACDLCIQYSNLFDCVRSLHGLSVLPFLPLSVQLDNSTVMDFLSQNSICLYKYVSSILTVFADGE